MNRDRHIESKTLVMAHGGIPARFNLTMIITLRLLNDCMVLTLSRNMSARFSPANVRSFPTILSSAGSRRSAPLPIGSRCGGSHKLIKLFQNCFNNSPAGIQMQFRQIIAGVRVWLQKSVKKPVYLKLVINMNNARTDRIFIWLLRYSDNV